MVMPSWWNLSRLLQVLVGGLALATVGGFFGVYAWWLDVLADFRVQYALAAVVLFGACLAWRRKKEAVLALALLIPNGWTVYTNWGDADDVSGALKIVSYNIYFKNLDIAPAFDFLRRENADVVVVTEATDVWRTAFKDLSDVYPHQFFGPLYKGVNDKPHRIGILAKRRWMKTGVEWSDASARAYAIWVRFPAASPSLTVAGVHLLNPILHPASFQKAENEALATLVKRFDGPVVVAGDFNMTPFSTRFGRLLKEADLRRATGGLNTTWPSLLTPLGLGLDHFLVSSKVKRAAMRVGPRLWSDHRPIVGTFDLER
ncbi:MAG: endonuclease/exonuclease/phosphatase family protein [Rhodospirillales bacterium]|nr:endonuclease/exonuclease/phosphatase family protein [Rhodospirillales bacterium]